MVAVLLLHAGRQQGLHPEDPVATKRVLRGILKATDFCASDPEGAARRMVDGGFTTQYDYALQTLKEVPYNKWREYDPEDTIRFWALRLREAGMIKSNPNKIIADATDWRFLNEAQARVEGLKMRAALTLTLAALVTLASLLLVLSRDAPQHTSLEPPLPKIGPAPEFAPTSQDGAPVTLADFRGKVVAVTFIFTMCTATCPVLTPMMSFVQDQLGSDFGAKIAFVSITVLPGTRYARCAEGVCAGVRCQPHGLELPHRRSGDDPGM